MHTAMKKFSLLLLCLPGVTMVSLLASSMNYISMHFSQYNETIVTMLMTIPNLSVIIGLIAAPILLKRFSIKKITIFGMILFTCSSVMPAWCDNFGFILVLRIITGISCGFILPLQETYFACYPEKERATLMGLNVTVGCLIAAILAALSGVIAEVDWHYVFYLYVVNIIGVALAIIFLPEHANKNDQSMESEANSEAATKLSDYINVLLVYYVLLGGYYICISVIASQIALYVVNTGLGGAVESGILISVDMVGCLLAGLIMGQYMRILKGFSLPAVFLCSAVAFLILCIAPTIEIAGIGIFILGMFASMVACVVNYELSVRLPLNLFTIASAGSNFLLYVLQFTGPILFTLVLKTIAGGSFRITFMFYAIFQAIFIAVALILPKVFLKDGKMKITKNVEQK